MVSTLAPVPKPPKGKRARNIVTGVTLAGQMPALEHVRKGHSGYVWRLWLSYDDKYRTGMYLEMHDDGSIWRYVVQDGQIKKADEVKAAD